MHSEAYRYVAGVLQHHPVQRTDIVLEIGSYDVNGSIRPLFAAAAQYVGCDVRPGPGVDLVGHPADIAVDGPGPTIVICCEALEHDSEPERTIAAAERLLQPGGRIIITAAGLGRAPHGCDGGPLPVAGEHYATILSIDLARWLNRWGNVQIDHNPHAGDIYATATKPNQED